MTAIRRREGGIASNRKLVSYGEIVSEFSTNRPSRSEIQQDWKWMTAYPFNIRIGNRITECAVGD